MTVVELKGQTEGEGIQPRVAEFLRDNELTADQVERLCELICLRLKQAACKGCERSKSCSPSDFDNFEALCQPDLRRIRTGFRMCFAREIADQACVDFANFHFGDRFDASVLERLRKVAKRYAERIYRDTFGSIM